MSNIHYESVVEFMTMMGQQVAEQPGHVTPKVAKLRYDLIKEEAKELEEAIFNDDYVEIADALADLLYVIYGAHATYGLPVKDISEYDIFRVNPAQLVTTPVALNGLRSMHTELEGLREGWYDTAIYAVHENLDALLVTTYRLAAFYGIAINSCFMEVHASNMSKSDKTREEAISSLSRRKADPETASKYENAEIHEVAEGVWILRRSDNHKVLKGMGYFEPNLKQFLEL